jgi:hypothetical protein
MPAPMKTPKDASAKQHQLKGPCPVESPTGVPLIVEIQQGENLTPMKYEPQVHSIGQAG